MLSRPGLSLTRSVGNETVLRVVLPAPAVAIVMGRSILWETAKSNGPWWDCVRKKEQGRRDVGYTSNWDGSMWKLKQNNTEEKRQGSVLQVSWGRAMAEGITKGTGAKNQRGFIGVCSRVEKQWTCWKGFVMVNVNYQHIFSALKCNLLGKNETVF